MPPTPFSRRSLLIGGGLGVGLLVGYRFWPRDAAPLIGAGRNEHRLGGFIRVAEDGVVTVAVPQVELGQGVFTGLAQIVASELGADWSKVGVEVALPGALADNDLLEAEWDGAKLGYAATGGSTSVRGFEARLRDAGAAARAMLCVAAAARLGVDWPALATHGGYVWHGDARIAFGELAVDAARAKLPDHVAWLEGREHRLVSVALPRIDIPAKVDGQAQFAGDIRLPGLVYASIASGPTGATRLAGVDKAAARGIRGLLQVIETERWVAAAATNWWAANRAVEAMHPRFETRGDLPDDKRIAAALTAALADEDRAERLAQTGDVHAAFSGAEVVTQTYHVGLAPHAAVETATATATIEDGVLRVWTNTQVPALAVEAAARATGLALDKVVVQPMLVGGAFGARYEVEIVEQAALLAQRLGRPVQLTRSRAEEMRRDSWRPASAIRLAARTGPEGRIDAWFAQVAAPATVREQAARITGGAPGAGGAERAVIAGAVPPYAIANVATDHHPADIGVPTGDWRGRAHVANAFASECFIDELAARAGLDPFSYRMAMLGDDVRLARCLSRVVALGNWDGGNGAQGIACHAVAGSHAAVLAEAYLVDGRIKVARLVAVVDVGRVINPDIVRAQIMGGLMFGMAAATGTPVTVTGGIAGPTRYGALGLPRMADCPDVNIELIASVEPPGGAGEITVPPVAPAIAGALFAATGVRYRRLPLISR